MRTGLSYFLLMAGSCVFTSVIFIARSLLGYLRRLDYHIG